MKRHFYPILVALLAALFPSVVSAADDSPRYYLDIAQDNQKYYFTLNSATGTYELEIPELWGDFKIYNDLYVPGSGGQDNYIFGAADNFGGVTPSSEKKLSNPGSNMSVQGGGIIYGAKLVFDPFKKYLTIMEGSYDPPVSSDPAVSIKVTDKTVYSCTSARVDFTVSTANITDPASLEYTVDLIYQKHGNLGSGTYDHMEKKISGSNLSDSEVFNDLTIGTTTPIWLVVRTTYEGNDLINHAADNLDMPEVPIIIGQIGGSDWSPAVGERGTPMGSGIDAYYAFAVLLHSQGEFSFVSKLSDSWDEVNTAPRYAPSAKNTEAPLDTWTPYIRTVGSADGNWVPQNYNSGAPRSTNPDRNNLYEVRFSFPRQSIMVMKEIPTSAGEIASDADACGDIYNTQGVLVGRGMTVGEAQRTLPSGLYIVAGKKVLVR